MKRGRDDNDAERSAAEFQSALKTSEEIACFPASTFNRVTLRSLVNVEGKLMVVVMKHVLNRKALDAAEKARREVDMLRHLRNVDCVVQVFEDSLCRFDSGWIFAMEYLPGVRDGVDWCETKPSAEERYRVCKRVARAVAQLHSLGVAHRDIKPDNLTIDPSGKVTLIDFADAVQTAAAGQYAPHAGSLSYLAPEMQPEILCKRVREGEPCTYDACVRADLWALAITIIAFATNARPWERAYPTDPLFRPYASAVVEKKYTLARARRGEAVPPLDALKASEALACRAAADVDLALVVALSLRIAPAERVMLHHFF